MRRNSRVLRKCRQVLESLYGERLGGLVLYGSCARGTDTRQSDIDLLVLLRGPVNVAAEIRRIWDVLYSVQLESDRVISVHPADAQSYRSGEYALYRNVMEEGLAI